MNRIAVSLLAAILLCSAGPAAAAPSLTPVLHATDWLNGPAREADVAPTLRRLYAEDRAKGLEIIGVHSPETPAEKQRGYVAENIRAQGIRWPVAVDNDLALWNAYGVDAWPTQLFFDRHGHLKKVIIGDSQDGAVKATVEALLAEK